MKKEIQDWTEDDILLLIKSRSAESTTLEFKACDALRRMDKKDWRKEFAKDVSAFANSAGAIVIYGIIENRQTHEAELLDDGFDPAELNIETLEQLANSHIQRRIEGIKYKSIPLTGDTNGRYVYVLDIPESNHAPHMAGHRFYKRYNFESVYMEEHEVRERYRRESFPGKEIVEAWRDDVINPLIALLQTENRSLEQDTWTWNHHYNRFGGFTQIGDQSEFAANKEDFIERHSEVGGLLSEHDELVATVNDLGKLLFETVSKSSFIRDTFASTASEESLEALRTENPNYFSGKTGAEVYAELFGSDRTEQDRYDYFTERLINGASPANIQSAIAYWNAFSDRFRSLIVCPPLSEYRKKVEEARSRLLDLNRRIISMLKKIRKGLSERHKIPVEASQQATEYPYYESLGLRTRRY